MTQDTIVAILCSDLHLSHKPPGARSAEPDWYVAMARSLSQLNALADRYEVPIICAGDVFDTWRSPSELINWAHDHLPQIYAIPGQHDLPHHNLAEIQRTPYWSLVNSGRIINIPHDFPLMCVVGHTSHRLMLHGFPWGCDITPIGDIKVPEQIDVAVIHKYVCTATTNYPGAPEEAYISSMLGVLDNYNAAVIGDNHQAFKVRVGQCTVLNCGTFMRRKMNEMCYRPTVGLLRADGKIKRHTLDVSADLFAERLEQPAEYDNQELREFVSKLGELEGESLDFTGAVRRFVEDEAPSPAVSQLLLEAIGDRDDRPNRRGVS